MTDMNRRAKKRRRGLDDTLPPYDHSVGFRGYGNQTLRVSKGLKGFKFGPANRGRRFTKTEIEAYEKSKAETQS